MLLELLQQELYFTCSTAYCIIIFNKTMTKGMLQFVLVILDII